MERKLLHKNGPEFSRIVAGAWRWHLPGEQVGGGTIANEKQEVFFSTSKKYGATVAQLALAWLLKHPSSIFPVIGTTNPERIKECAGAVGVQLELQDWFEMLKVAQGREGP